MIKCALATSHQFSELTKDDKLVYNKLLYYGVDVEPIVWDSKDVAWNQYDAVFIRSCWDYHIRHTEFFNWIDKLTQEKIAVFNPPELLKWNSNKKYLKDLAEKDIKIVPTVFVDKNSQTDIQKVLNEHNWQQAVVKPMISANALETWVTSIHDKAGNQKKLNGMFEQYHEVLIQQFIKEIHTKGEWAFIFFEKEFSHAVLKMPKEGDFRAQETYGGSVQGKKPPGNLVAQANKVIETIEGDCLYARVDGIEVGQDLILMELEVIEPALYLDKHPKAPTWFAESILKKLNNLTQETEG